MNTAQAQNRDQWTPLEAVVTKDVFKAEIAFWTKRIGVQPSQVHVRLMSRKWGSCSTAGRVTFNEELLRENADLRKEVIVHELLHLKVPNHGKLFKALLKAHLGKSALMLPPYPTRSRGRSRP
jgi:predicted metal-dependent hydrolase